MPVRAVKRGCRLMALSRGVEAIGAATNPQKLIFLKAELGGVRGTSSMPLKTRVTSPTVGQVDEQIRAADDTQNAPQQLATSQDRAVIDGVRDALI
ncbi:MAG: hypothetical protein WCA29_05065, partial [Jiangellales bacterium]